MSSTPFEGCFVALATAAGEPPELPVSPSAGHHRVLEQGPRFPFPTDGADAVGSPYKLHLEPGELS